MSIRRLAPLALVPLVAGLLLGAARPAAADDDVRTYRIDAVHSTVSFSIRHLVARVQGRFGEVSGTFEVNRDRLRRTTGEATVAVASIDTGNDRRDGHLRADDFFDAENHPDMRFVIDRVRPQGRDSARVEGRLTIKGVTKPVELYATDIAFLDMGPGKSVMGLEATTEIDRREFGISWNRVLDAGGLALGNEVRIRLNIEARQVDPEAEAEAQGQ